jgi:transcriptional regulator with XRE-family HTH domain
MVARTTTPPLPAIRRAQIALGARIRLARQRRRFSASLVAERAGMSRPTLRAVERGDAGVTFGALANVLHSLGLIGDLDAVARDDVLGRKLDDLRLGPGRRVRSKSAR